MSGFSRELPCCLEGGARFSAFFGGSERESFEFGYELAQSSGVVEAGLVALELVGAEQSGDGLSFDFSGPLDVGAVQLRRVRFAAAGGLAAAGVPHDDAAGEHEVERG